MTASFGSHWSARETSLPLPAPMISTRLNSPHTRFPSASFKSRCNSAQDAAKWAAKELPADGYAGQTTWTPPFPDYGFYRVRASLLAEDSAEALLDREEVPADAAKTLQRGEEHDGEASEQPPYQLIVEPKFAQRTQWRANAGATQPMVNRPRQRQRDERLEGEQRRINR